MTNKTPQGNEKMYIPKIKSTKWYGWFWLPEIRKVKLMQSIINHEYPKMKPYIDKAVKDGIVYGKWAEYEKYYEKK